MAWWPGILLLLFTPCAAFRPAAPSLEEARAEARKPVRVSLRRYFARAAALALETPPGAQLLAGDTALTTETNRTWRLAARAGRVTVTDLQGAAVAAGPMVRIEPPEEARPLALALPTPSSSSPASARRYRGALEITAEGETLRVINILPLETYLRGVVAAEMPPSSPPDALRAQAICARTFALKCRGRYAGRGFDVTDTTDSQVYGGVAAERETTDAAVRDTEGLALARDGALIWADYYDDCGGVTSPGSGAGDFPPSVRDAPEEGGSDYCARGTYHTWTLTLSAGEIARRLDASTRARLGALREITILEADPSGRAQRVALAGEAGRREIKGEAFRALLGYDRLKSTLFTVQRTEEGGFVFAGRGYGHGHGLCQWGAMGMAAAPYHRTYREILAHYYPGAALISLTGRPEAAPARGSLSDRHAPGSRRTTKEGRRGGR